MDATPIRRSPSSTRAGAICASSGHSRRGPLGSRLCGSRPGTVRRFEAEELRVLQMLEQGRISSQDAADLIAALQGAAPPVTGEEEAPA